MAKELYPSRRGPGRAEQRVKPGDTIRAMFAKYPRGVTIGDCHRYYTAQKLNDWQIGEMAKLAGVDRVEVSSANVQSLLGEKAVRVHPRSPIKQSAFVSRKMKTVNKLMAKKRAPLTANYMTFARFFHALVQLGYIKPEIKRDRVGNPVRSRRAPEVPDGDAILEAKLAGKKTQIEPPVVYLITDAGWSAPDWNNPRKGIA